MNIWPDTVQKMADWIECHITEQGTLTDMARAIGYSPTYKVRKKGGHMMCLPFCIRSK